MTDLTLENPFSLEELESTYYEAHKDAYGWRDRSDRSHWTKDDYEREIARCCEAMEEEHYLEGFLAFESACTYNREIAELLALGASDRQTAVRWWYEANGFEDPGFAAGRGQEAESVLYRRGFPIPMWKHILPEFTGEPMPAWGY